MIREIVEHVLDERFKDVWGETAQRLRELMANEGDEALTCAYEELLRSEQVISQSRERTAQKRMGGFLPLHSVL